MVVFFSNTMEAIVTDTLVSGQLYVRPPSKSLYWSSRQTLRLDISFAFKLPQADTWKLLNLTIIDTQTFVNFITVILERRHPPYMGFFQLKIF